MKNHHFTLVYIGKCFINEPILHTYVQYPEGENGRGALNYTLNALQLGFLPVPTADLAQLEYIHLHMYIYIYTYMEVS